MMAQYDAHCQKEIVRHNQHIVTYKCVIDKFMPMNLTHLVKSWMMSLVHIEVSKKRCDEDETKINRWIDHRVSKLPPCYVPK